MDLIARVEHNFNASIRAGMESIPLLAGPVADAGDLIVRVLLQGGKIMSCGNGGSAAAAQYFASLMLNRFERERPGLPALALTTDSTTLTSIAADYDLDEIFAKQLHALGQGTDLLLTISNNDNVDNVIAAVEAAHEREMPVIALSGGQTGRLARLLQGTDVEIRVPDDTHSRVLEVHFMTLHCLCDLIDRQLLGG